MTEVEAIVLAIATLVVGALAVYATLHKAAPSQPPPQTVINNYKRHSTLVDFRRSTGGTKTPSAF